MGKPTPRGKLVKLIAIAGTLCDCDQGPAATTTVTDEYIFQDDFRLIGCQVEITMDVDSGGELDAGDFYAHAELSLSGINPVDGVNLRDGAILCANVKAATDDTPSIAVGGQMRQQADIMFPEGYGVDFDYLSKIYLHCSGINRMGATAGDMSAKAFARLYVVER